MIICSLVLPNEVSVIQSIRALFIVGPLSSELRSGRLVGAYIAAVENPPANVAA